MSKESKLNMNASDYAISHCNSDKTYNGLEVRKMLCDAYIAGNNNALDDKDEEIRNALINVFATHKDYEVFFGVSTKDIRAWLEKQGEPMEINPTEFDTRLQNLIGKFDNLPKEDLIGSLSFWMNVVQNDGTYKPDKKQSEQKLAWGEEDEKMYRGVIAVCDVWSTATSFYPKENEDVERLKNWLKSLKDRVQPKQEWYEGDVKINII